MEKTIRIKMDEIYDYGHYRSNLKPIIIGTLFFVFMIIAGSGVLGGKTEVLEDMRNLSYLYIENRCDDITNFTFGSLESCKENSSSTFTLNFNIGLPLLATVGNIDGNSSLYNASRDGLLAMVKLQNDIGDFAVEGQDTLQDPTFAPVQVYMLAIALTDTYDRLDNNNFTSEQNNSIKGMFKDLVSWMTIEETVISYEGAFTGADRFNSNYFRKQLNISKQALDNTTDNVHLGFRVNHQGDPVNHNISVYIGTDTAINYTYNTTYGFIGKTNELELQLNKTHLINNCNTKGDEYLCNFTFQNNSAWSSTDSFRLVRGLRDGDHTASWTSTDGVTFAASAQEYMVRLNYYDNTSLNKINERRATLNQHLTKGLACYRMYRILNNSADYNLSGSVAERCYKEIADNVLNYSTSDGVYGEWNEQYRKNNAGNSSKPEFLGYSNHYQWITAFTFAQLYNLTGNISYLESLNNSVNNLTYFIYDSDLKRAGGIGTRTQTNSTRLESLGNKWKNYNLLGFFSLVDEINPQANAINDKIKTYTKFYPHLNYSGIVRYAYDMYPIIYLYENFPTSTTTEQMLTNQTRYIKSFNDTGLVSLATGEYRSFIAFRNNSPSGVLGEVSNRNNKLTLFSGGADSPHNNTFGLGSLNTNISGLNYSNVFDTITNLTILNISYPYQLRFSGNLTQINVSNRTEIAYNTTYTFYDNYIEVTQNTTSDVELQLWSVSREVVGVNNITRNVPMSFNNATFLPTNFQLEYQDTENTASFGIVDLFNSTGSDFHYYIGIETYSNNEYFTDSNNKRLALPLSVSGTNTLKTIENNLTDTISNITVIIDTKSCDINYITYTSDSGAFTRTYDTPVCTDDKTVNLTIEGIESSSSNQVEIVYNTGVESICRDVRQSFQEIPQKLTILALIIAVGVILGILLTFTSGKDSIDTSALRNLVIVGITLMLVGLIFGFGADILNGVCT